MNTDQKYLFDLTGYLIIENALTAEEVIECNAAIDHHIESLRERDTSLAAARQHSLAPHTEWTWGVCLHGRNLGVNLSATSLCIRRLNRTLKRS